ncbi:MAG: hypothetical protein J6X44_11165 [Thermoguttaceae bacterium]|nr:hypothetical protein [Thermoguttaceae bacterium]
MFKKLILIIAVLALFACVPIEAAAPNYYPARLCNSCGFGSKRQNCVKCDKWTGTTHYNARLCNSCGFGTKNQNCVKCGKWIGSSNYYEAWLCNSCGFGHKDENCVKCGKWAH